MARKDKIYLSFLNHELISGKYGLKKTDLPNNLRDGLQSKHTIIKALALIVDDMESINPSADKSLYSKITQFLNETPV